MHLKIKPLAATATAAALVAAGALAFVALKENYVFRSEPHLTKQQVTLEKKALRDRQPLTTELCREQLGTDAQKQAYAAISENVFDTAGGRFSVYGADKNDFQIALNAFLVDHPEVFWVDAASGYTYSENQDGLLVELQYLQTGSELKASREKLNAAVEKAAKEAPDNASDYDVELFLNDYIAKTCEYDASGDMKHNAYGALINGKAVCDGYSRAFQLLCRRLGIACTVIEGTSDFNSDGEDGHMWNCVSVGGRWYHTDVTWNDSTDAQCEAEHYFYLNLSTNMILKDHIISGGFESRFNNRGNLFNVFVPSCDSDTLNYMQLNFVNVNNPENDDEALASMIDAAKNKRSYCAFRIDDSVDFNEVSQNIINGYAASWVRGANHFLNGSVKIADSGKVFIYEKKRVLAIQLKYE